MTKSHLPLETAERWRTIVLVIGMVCLVVGLVLGFPFILSPWKGQGSGASHQVGSDTFRTFELAGTPLAVLGMIIAGVGVFLLLFGYFVLR